MHQPRRGIAAARNAILDKATELGADWLAMIDDDEITDADWIAKMMVPEYRHVGVLGGRRLWIYPEPRPFWAPENQLKGFTEGAPSSQVGTGNVRFTMALVRAGLRFDETLGPSGGEDFQFFSDAKQAGFEVRRTNHALVREAIHPARMTYWFTIKRQYAHMAWIAHRQRRETGAVPLALQLPKVAFLALVGTLELMISPIAYAFGRRRFKQIALRGGKRIAMAAGATVALAEHLPQPYTQVAGH